jgi:hypothetical protein
MGLAVVGLALTAALAIVFVVAAAVLSRGSAHAPFAELQVIASSALAWGCGFLIALGASWRILRTDAEEGIFSLVRTRGVSLDGYLLARIGGVATCVLVAVAGGVLITALACIAFSTPSQIPRTIHASVATLAYAIAFSICAAPLAMAALGARSRGAGYAILFLLLIIPDLAAPWTSDVVPYAWRDVVSIPRMLAAIRGSLLVRVDAYALARGAVAVCIVAGLCTLLARVQLRVLANDRGVTT